MAKNKTQTENSGGASAAFQEMDQGIMLGISTFTLTTGSGTTSATNLYANGLNKIKIYLHIKITRNGASLTQHELDNIAKHLTVTLVNYDAASQTLPFDAWKVEGPWNVDHPDSPYVSGAIRHSHNDAARFQDDPDAPFTVNDDGSVICFFYVSHDTSDYTGMTIAGSLEYNDDDSAVSGYTDDIFYWDTSESANIGKLYNHDHQFIKDIQGGPPSPVHVTVLAPKTYGASDLEGISTSNNIGHDGQKDDDPTDPSTSPDDIGNFWRQDNYIVRLNEDLRSQGFFIADYSVPDLASDYSYAAKSRNCYEIRGYFWPSDIQSTVVTLWMADDDTPYPVTIDLTARSSDTIIITLITRISFRHVSYDNSYGTGKITLHDQFGNEGILYTNPTLPEKYIDVQNNNYAAISSLPPGGYPSLRSISNLSIQNQKYSYYMSPSAATNNVLGMYSIFSWQLLPVVNKSFNDKPTDYFNIFQASNANDCIYIDNGSINNDTSGSLLYGAGLSFNNLSLSQNYFKPLWQQNSFRIINCAYTNFLEQSQDAAANSEFYIYGKGTAGTTPAAIWQLKEPS